MSHLFDRFGTELSNTAKIQDYAFNANSLYKTILGEPSSIEGIFLKYSHNIQIEYSGKTFNIEKVAVGRNLGEKMTTKQVAEELRNPSTKLIGVITPSNWLVITEQRIMGLEELSK